MTIPPRVLDNLDYISQILSADRAGLFSDFDGTLAPIFDDPRDTVLSPAMRDTLSELSRELELVAVVSGRDLKTLLEMVGLNSVTYVGNHGLEVWKAGGERAEREAQVADGLMGDVEKGVGGIGVSGLSLEDKGMSVAVHYRNAPDPTAARSMLLANDEVPGCGHVVWRSGKARWSWRSYLQDKREQGHGSGPDWRKSSS